MPCVNSGLHCGLDEGELHHHCCKLFVHCSMSFQKQGLKDTLICAVQGVSHNKHAQSNELPHAQTGVAKTSSANVVDTILTQP